MKFNFDFEDIKYIKISYKDNLNNNHSIKAGIKNINDREIVVCSKFENGLNIKTPQEITLNIICKDGLYKTKTNLKSIENDEPYTFFYLETPKGFEYQQNREYFRVLLNQDCTYSVRQNGELKRYKVKTTNISANGICIETPELIISEQDSYISLNAGSKIIEVRVKYIRSERVNDGFLISFSYINILESDRDLISQICIKKQLEQKRSSLF